MDSSDLLGEGSGTGEELELDLRYLPGPEQKGTRPDVRSLGRVACEFLDEGGPPPVPRPTVGLVEGVDLPLLYPGLNAIGGPASVGKSVLTKFLVRQQVRAGRHVLVMDCETSEEEYGATLVSDFGMSPAELDLVHYVTDAQRTVPRRDRWSGEAVPEEVLDGLDCAPSLVVIDSQSKSMALLGLDENRPDATTTWFEAVAVPITDRWPEAAVVTLQARQKGWVRGMDVRQGRGSSSLLHEVHSQYMMWVKHAGSRTKDGEATLIATKCRYGWRAEGSKAARWLYGPSGFYLVAPEVEVDDLPDLTETKGAVLDWLETRPLDPDRPGLPPKPDHVVDQVAVRLGLSSTAGRARVTEGLDALIKGGQVQRQKVAQGVSGVRPWRVWSGEADPAWDW